MSGLVVTKMHHLAGEFEDLKGRLRIALAGELARHVATAIGDVVRAVVAGETIPRMQRTPFDRRAVETDPWAENDEDSFEPESYRYPNRDCESDPPASDPPANANASVAVAASVYVARWWILGRRGTLLGAVGAGMGIGLLGLVGGPLARTVLIILAATGDLLSVSEIVGTSASRLKQA